MSSTESNTECSLVALRDKVVVELIATDKSKHGPSALIVTTSDKIDDVKRGRVVSAGEGFLTPNGEQVSLRVDPGDVVIFPENAGKVVWSYGMKFLVIREQDILAIER